MYSCEIFSRDYPYYDDNRDISMVTSSTLSNTWNTKNSYTQVLDDEGSKHVSNVCGSKCFFFYYNIEVGHCGYDAFNDRARMTGEWRDKLHCMECWRTV